MEDAVNRAARLTADAESKSKTLKQTFQDDNNVLRYTMNRADRRRLAKQQRRKK